jgi:pilus assembly protein CpaB
MKNRTIIGIVCIVLALILTFAIAPLVNKMAESKVDIVRMKQDVVQGHQISENDVEVVKVGGYNLPADVIQRKENVVR